MNNDKICKNCQHPEKKHYHPTNITETEVDNSRYIRKCLESGCKCERFEIQDKNLELCKKCLHPYHEHADFNENQTKIDDSCNICECAMFIPSGKFLEGTK